eukprot:COSAG05_NODE_765_length_7475_cov_6.478986_7_plen_83_part_00
MAGRRPAATPPACMQAIDIYYQVVDTLTDCRILLVLVGLLDLVSIVGSYYYLGSTSRPIGMGFSEVLDLIGSVCRGSDLHGQ